MLQFHRVVRENGVEVYEHSKYYRERVEQGLPFEIVDQRTFSWPQKNQELIVARDDEGICGVLLWERKFCDVAGYFLSKCMPRMYNPEEPFGPRPIDYLLESLTVGDPVAYVKELESFKRGTGWQLLDMVKKEPVRAVVLNPSQSSLDFYARQGFRDPCPPTSSHRNMMRIWKPEYDLVQAKVA